MSDAPRPVPRSTYRLQLSKAFRFRDAEAIASYLQALGISHVYLSPILAARPGSTHGYDTIDHTRINPELGTLDEFRQMARTLRDAGISIVLDIVPNHMGVGGDGNALWLDVLEWGRVSPYADWFDIDWEPSEPSLRHKVLVPFLGSAYGEALRDGAVELPFDAEAGSFAVWLHGEHKLPVCPAHYGALLETVAGPLAAAEPQFEAATTGAGGRSAGESLKRSLARLCREQPAIRASVEAEVRRRNDEPGRAGLAALIERQAWRPARYSVAADDINYRRFFVVSDLAAVRVEREDVFEHVHALTFQLVAEGWIDGLRIDHIDGLYDPKAYCLALRARCPRPIYLVVEKILAEDEPLRADWNVDGTTGYEFAAAATRLLTDPAGERSLSGTYAQFTGRDETLDEIEAGAKLDIIDFEMAAELDGLASRLRAIAAADPLTADLMRNALRSALRAIVASLAVYRTYVAEGEVGEDDLARVRRAVARAVDATPALAPEVFAFIERVLTSAAPGPALEAAMRVQQYSGPVMAKGLEDTALYRFNRLIALSDVGQRPDRFNDSVADFHAFMTERLSGQRHGLLTSSSHDTKRGEDTRARIAALSGCAEAWAGSVAEWTQQLAGQGAPEIDRNDLYYFLQMLVGAWPAEFAEGVRLPEGALEAFRERMDQAMLKSIREARVHTNWMVPRADYEAQVKALVQAALSSAPDNAFLASFRRFEAGIAWSGAQNGLIQCALKLTAPGIPDIYQGAELWEQSLVDPDNRRPVDYGRRAALLREVSGRNMAELARDFRSGAIKLALVSRLLAFRTDHPRLFAEGSYEPVALDGADAERVVAYLRQGDGQEMLVLACLQPWRGEPSAELPDPLRSGVWRDVIRAKDVAFDGRIAGLFADGVPVAVLAAPA